MIDGIMSTMGMSKKNNELNSNMESIWMQIHECTDKYCVEKCVFP
jgi:hypothetical protein